jgi:cytochrome c5
MRRLVLVTASCLAVGLAACAHGAGAPPPSADGALLYRRSCASCHRLKAPAEHDAATWRRAVERYGFRLTAAERAAIVGHLAGPRP